MATVIFTAYDLTNSESDLHSHSGQEVTILDRLTPADGWDPEAGAMYRVRFSDGFEAEAFDEELTVLP